MSRARETGIITCPHDSMGNPRPPVTTTIGETWVLLGMQVKAGKGVTTRDFLGADLRHYIRNFKNKGIGIREEWETDSFGRHKRWFLKDGHKIERVPKRKKPDACSKRASNSIPDGENGGVTNE